MPRMIYHNISNRDITPNGMNERLLVKNDKVIDEIVNFAKTKGVNIRIIESGEEPKTWIEIEVPYTRTEWWLKETKEE